MNLTKIKLTQFLGIILLALTLAACGGGGGGDSTPTNNDGGTGTGDGGNGNDGGSGGDQTTHTAAKGKLVYENKHPKGNTFACMHCHAITENDMMLAPDGFKRPGNPLFNAINRTSYKNGALTEIMDAANSCLEDWMTLSSADLWTESSDDWLNFKKYLEEQSNNSTEANVTYSIVSAPGDMSGGNATTGQTEFKETCAVCHGETGLGTDVYRAPITGRNLSKTYIASKIRRSGPDSSNVYSGLDGGQMPFYSKERMTDQTVKNIAAYVAGEAISSFSCGDNDHPKVGQTMTFSMKAHDVSGNAEIIDNCTIRVSNFNYDGGGPQVLFYGGVDGDYKDSTVGFAIGSQLNRSSAYVNETLTLSLNSPSTLDMMNGLSVWCAAVNTSFGDGIFN
ncbi:DM13 domain-containing protein [Saccharobesus litoralis]|nr:DM13 domain-containing protein [Saccharobesus litoralis]